jgi:hypothetical protein
MSDKIQNEMGLLLEEKFNNIDRIKFWKRDSLSLRFLAIFLIFSPVTLLLCGLYGYGFELPSDFTLHVLVVLSGIILARKLELKEKVNGSMRYRNRGETFFPLSFKWQLDFPKKKKQCL